MSDRPYMHPDGCQCGDCGEFDGDGVFNTFTEATNSKSTPLTAASILAAIEELKSIGPVFTAMTMPKVEYEKLVVTASSENKVAGESLIGGVVVSMNPWLPEHMLCAYDTHGNLWVIDIRAPTEMRNLGRPDRILDPMSSFFRP